MGKINLLFVFCLASITAYAYEDWHVTEEPTKKNVLVEEFTGIHCGFCPQAHTITNNMVTARPEAVSIIAMHAGGFAVPTPVIEPDFRTEAGNMIHDSYPVNGYPSGMVNRTASTVESESPLSSRSEWTEIARQQVNIIAPVNIWANAEYEGSERMLTVDVEGYMQVDPTDYPDLRINIALTQNNIQGPQNGALDSNNYYHQHVLRDYLTYPFGDPIDGFQDNKFKAHYTYEIPQEWNNINVDPRELMVVVFFTEGEKGEVLNSMSVIPEYKNYEPRASYQLKDYKLPIDGTSYGYDFIDLYFRNLSAEKVTDLCFEISSANTNVTSTLSDLEIAPMHNSHLRVPCEGMTDMSGGKVKVKLTNVNGKSVTVTPLELTIDEVKKTPNKIKIVIRTDNDASDNVWVIRDAKGEDVKTFGPFDNGVVTEYSADIELENDRLYCFEVEDSWGDGVLNPRGMVKIYDTNGNLLANNLQIQTHGTRIFFFTDSSLGIWDTETTESSDKYEYYTIDGISLGSTIPSTIHGIVVRKGGNKAVLLKK